MTFSVVYSTATGSVETTYNGVLEHMELEDENEPVGTRRRNDKRYVSVIDMLPLGESFAVASKISLSFGMGDKDRVEHVNVTRVRLDNLVARSRRKFPGRKFVVEAFAQLSLHGAHYFTVAVATRVE